MPCPTDTDFSGIVEERPPVCAPKTPPAQPGNDPKRRRNPGEDGGAVGVVESGEHGRRQRECLAQSGAVAHLLFEVRPFTGRHVSLHDRDGLTLFVRQMIAEDDAGTLHGARQVGANPLAAPEVGIRSGHPQESGRAQCHQRVDDLVLGFHGVEHHLFGGVPALEQQRPQDLVFAGVVVVQRFAEQRPSFGQRAPGGDVVDGGVWDTRREIGQLATEEVVDHVHHERVHRSLRCARLSGES